MNPRPRLLDLFCKAGGAAKGYADAGFDVVGVDIEPQPHYPFEFHQANALTYPLDGFDAIHASPPCQDYSVTRVLHTAEYPRLIGPMRARLIAAGVPYVIENVNGARSDMRNPVMLCGSTFGLGVWRHRLFETSWPVLFAPPCAHYLVPEPVDVTGTGGRRRDPRSGTRHPGGGDSRKPLNLAHARHVMGGLDWMTRPELSEAIPPAFTEWVGIELLTHLESRAVA